MPSEKEPKKEPIEELGENARDPGDEDRRLPPPPRAVSPALARYLSASTFHVVLTLFGFFLIPFWSDCGFGADVESLAFLRPLSQAQGRVLRFERTGARQGTGSVPLGHYTALETPKTPDVPVYAVHFAYAPPGGAPRAGVCFAPGATGEPGLPFAEAPPPDGSGFAAPNPPLTPGTAVTVQTVSGWPGVARIRGTRTNLFELHMLIIAVFPGVFALLLIRGRAVRRGLLHVVEVGREDAARDQLLAPREAGAPDDPAAQEAPLNRGALRRVVVQGGTLVPPAGWALRLCTGPLLALGCNVWYIGTHAKAIFYPLRVFLHLGH